MEVFITVGVLAFTLSINSTCGTDMLLCVIYVTYCLQLVFF